MFLFCFLIFCFAFCLFQENYYIAEFKLSKTVECAPRKWISYDASKCHWPCVANVLPLQRKGVDPDTMPDVVWEVHDIRILHHYKGYGELKCLPL